MCMLSIWCMNVWTCSWTCTCGHAHVCGKYRGWKLMSGCLSQLLFTSLFVCFVFFEVISLTEIWVCYFDYTSRPQSTCLHSSVLGLQTCAAFNLYTGPGIQTQVLWLWASTLPANPHLQMWRKDEDEWVCTVWHRHGHAQDPSVSDPWEWQSPPRVSFRRMTKTFLWSEWKCWQFI